MSVRKFARWIGAAIAAVVLVPLVVVAPAAAGGFPAEFYLSSSSSGSVPSGVGGGGTAIPFGNEDVLVYDASIDEWTMAFDGSAAGVGSGNVDGFSIDDSGDYLISFAGPLVVPGIAGTVDDSDIVTWDGASFSLLIDGSDVGLSAGGEDIDAIDWRGATDLAISTSGSSNVPHSLGGTLQGRDEDLLDLTTTLTGPTTAGAFSLLFDGSDLAGVANEDVSGASIDPATGTVYLSMLGNYTAEGVVGDSDDVKAFTGSLGDSTSGTFATVFDGDVHDFADEQIDALHFIPTDPPPPGSADVGVFIVDNVDPVVEGAEVTYTIDVENDGPDEAVNVVATYNLPAGVSFLETVGCAQSPADGPCSLGSIASGAEKTFFLRVTVDAGTSGTVTLSASATSDTPDPGPLANTASEDTFVGVLPLPEDDGPATNSEPGDPFHTAFNTTLTVADGSAEDLLNNDFLGLPDAAISHFGSEDAFDFEDGETETTLGGGSLTVNSDGSFELTPAPGFEGIFTFEYLLENSVGSNIGTVSIYVGDRPMAGGADIVYISSSSSGVVDGIPFDDEDILRYDTMTDTWSMHFDGSDVGLAGADVDGFTMFGNLPLISLTGPFNVPGIGLQDDSDAFGFTGGFGDETVGGFMAVVDGSTVGLTSGGEDVDAVTNDADDLFFSTSGAFNVPGSPSGNLTGGDEDLIGVIGSSFFMEYDGSAVGMPQNLMAAHIDGETDTLFGSSLNSYSVPGLSGDGDDIWSFNGTHGLYLDGDDVRIGGEQFDALYLELAAENTEPDALADGGFTDEDTPTSLVIKTEINGLSSPGSVAVDPANGNLVVANSSNNEVLVFDSDGSPVTTNFPLFSAPVGVAVDPLNSNVVIANESSGSVEVFDSAGNVTPIEIGDFDLPQDIAVDPNNGNVHVAELDDDNSLERVDVFTRAGVFTGVSISIDNPAAVAVDPSNSNILVASNGQVVVHDSAGAPTTTVISGLEDPKGIAVNPFTDDILVADGTGGRVIGFDQTGAPTGLVIGGLPTVSGVAVNPNNGDIVVAAGNSVLVYTDSLLDNDTDADGDSLTVTSFDAVTGNGASVNVNADGTFTYDQGALFDSFAVGDFDFDTFDYTVSDGNGGTDTATVTIFIDGLNDAPIANDDGPGVGFTTDEDTPFLTLDVVLNDTDVDDGAFLFIDSHDAVSNGGALISDGPDGQLNYDPNGQFESLDSGESTTDTFSYTVSDGEGGTDTATVTITINGVDDVPPGNYGDFNGTGVDFLQVTEMTTSAGDPAILWTAPTLNGAGDQLDFTMSPSFNSSCTTGGSDVTSSQLMTTIMAKSGNTIDEVMLVWNGDAELNATPPSGDPSTNAGATIAGSLKITETTAGPILPFVIPIPLVSVADRELPGDLGNTNWNSGTFTFHVSLAVADATKAELTTVHSLESNCGSPPSEVNSAQIATTAAAVTAVVVQPNDPPEAMDDDGPGYGTDEDTAFTTANVLDNDTDPDFDTLTIQSFSPPSDGMLSSNGDGTFVYDPNGQFDFLEVGQTTTDEFTYTVTDGNGGIDVGTVMIEITGINDPPVAGDDGPGAGFTTDEETSFTTANVAGNDFDPEGIFSITAFDATGAFGGQISSGPGNNFVYDPAGAFDDVALGESTTDTFTYTITDSEGLTDTATVTITIDGVNDDPTAVDDDGFSTDEDTPILSGDVLGNDSDPDLSDMLTASLFSGPDNGGLVSFNGDGTFDYDPNDAFDDLLAGEIGFDTFTYQVDDGNGGFDMAEVTIEIVGT